MPMVRGRWGDSGAARELGITTYLSEPVHVVAGELYGTLCGASRARVQIPADTRRLLKMFSQLIARQLERERLLAQLKNENREFRQHALSDPLTGIPNRRALANELGRALANADRAGTVVHVAFIDLDEFKAINDEHGHDTGDRFLIAIAQALLAGYAMAILLRAMGVTNSSCSGRPLPSPTMRVAWQYAIGWNG